MHKIRFRLGLCPRSCWGSLQCSPDSLAGFKGLLLKGREGRGGKGRVSEGRKWGGKRREGERKGVGERNKNPPSDRSGYGLDGSDWQSLCGCALCTSLRDKQSKLHWQWQDSYVSIFYKDQQTH